MKVLFITRKWPPAVGGMETYSRELARELKKQVDLDLLVLPGREDGKPPGLIALALFFFRTAFALSRRGRSWDLVHFGDFVLFPLVWLHSKVSPSTPRVVTVHGLDVIFGNRTGWKAGIYRLFMSWAERHRDCLQSIIVNSRNTGRLVTKAGLGESVVIPLGVRLSATETANATPIEPDDRYVLFVGRLVRRKGAAWFATEVLPHLPQDVRFKVVGKTWDPSEDEALRMAPRVERLGYVTDQELARLRAGAVAVVMPNIPSEGEQDVEGFGITALEAAVGGAPLVAAELEGVADAVIDGVTGFLLEPLQPMIWADKICELLAWTPDQRHAFFETATFRVARDFSWSRVARDTVKVYDRLRVASPAAG